MPFDLPPPDPSIEISIASRGMSKGIAQTEGPQLVGKGFLQVGPLQAGGQWKNISSRVAGGEAAAFVTVAPKLGKFQLSLSAAYKIQTGVREPTDDKSWEFTGGVTRKFGKVSMRAGAIYSPDDLGGAKQSLVIEGGPSLEIDKTTRMSASLGHRSRQNGDDYTAFNAGVAKTVFKGATLDARLYGTNRGVLGANYKERAVVSVKMSF
jgi:hypothetical protein